MEDVEDAGLALNNLVSSLGSSSFSEELHRLIKLCRTQSQRRLLASLHAVPLLLSALPQLLLPSYPSSSSIENPCVSIPCLSILSLLLKLLRNLCAGEAPNQQDFLECDGVELVASVFSYLLGVFGNEDLPEGLSAMHLDPCQRRQQKLESQLSGDLSLIRSCIVNVFQMALQLLGNVSGGGEAQKEAIWKSIFPTTLRRLALMREEKILEPLCMVIYTCSNANRLRLTNLCRGEGAALLSTCLSTAMPSSKCTNHDFQRRNEDNSAPGVSNTVVNDWLYLLVSQLCLREPLFPVLFRNLLDPSPPGESSPYGAETMFCSEQVALLEMLSSLLREKQEACSRGSCFGRQEDNTLPMPSVSIGFLAEITQTASRLSDPGCPYLTLPCGIPSVDILGYALETIKILSAWECDGKPNMESPILLDIEERKSLRSSILVELISHGLIKLFLKLLRDIGPPELIFRAMKKNGEVNLAVGHKIEATNDSHILEMHIESTPERGEAQEPDCTKLNLVAEDTEKKPARLPYKGYRRDLVAVIGNASYRNQSVQDEVGNMGGLFLILQQCVVDTENPFLREWGLWAVRNLVEGNEKNNKEILEMELKGSFTPFELAEMGMKVEMDPLLGRPKLVIDSSKADSLHK